MPSEPTAAQDRETALYDALLWISEYPNREHIYSEEDGMELAEFAREVLNTYEASRV